MDSFKGVKPTKVSYDGISDPNEFIKSFKWNMMFTKLEEAKQLEAMEFCLTGKAERIYKAVVDKTKLENVTKALIEVCSQSQEVLLDAFEARKPREGELLSHFAIELQELLNKAVPTWSILMHQ